ncbi:hypothetical protein HanIR_Chr11g0539321 [Helianthus annuus]|nr:hypothetical protein HanIR_Chr11g0539321 [Helianthus annuus]
MDSRPLGRPDEGTAHSLKPCKHSLVEEVLSFVTIISQTHTNPKELSLPLGYLEPGDTPTPYNRGSFLSLL